MLMVLCVCSVTAVGLTPGEVLVVANASSDESVELARTYASLRSIPDENIALVETTTAYDVTRVNYEQQILLPLRKILIEREIFRQIRAIVLMRNVPLRVKAPERSSEEQAYRKITEKALYRLAVDYKLLGSVGLEFPEPRSRKFKPLGMLFDSPVPEPTKPLVKFAILQKNIEQLLEQKQIQIAKISDPAKRRIAGRQLMALQLDIGGLKGLIAYVEAANPPESPKLTSLKHLLSEAERQLSTSSTTKPTKDTIEAGVKLLDAIGGARLVYSYSVEKAGLPPGLTENQSAASKFLKATDASLDSELAMIWWPKYRLAGPLDNPLHWRRARALQGKILPPTIMTARIDGPTHADMLRIIQDSVAVQAEGLKGNFYIDAGGKVPQYDEHLRQLATFIRTNTKIETILDDQTSLFPEGSCPDAGLYVGWYSLQKYVPAFTWTPGAVGWHIASFEAVNLRDPNQLQWCVKMIQNGVVATVGAVEEPLLEAFPHPEDFFPLLLTGKYTLAECYWRTTPTVSWRMTLIGDPLYNPFELADDTYR
jgi:uncharacterized protein (TIGR03790 family)